MIHIVLIALASFAAFAQTAAPPAFEVAAIKTVQPGRESIEVVPGSLTMRNVRLMACLRWAFEIEDYQIVGPGWLQDVWFDISAKAASPVREPELRRMLQTLLAQRYKLEFHRQSKELSALILSVDKGGHKLQPVETEGSPSFKTGKLSLTGQGAKLSQLTGFLSHELHSPIIDQTGLTGLYNYTLDINAFVTEETMKSANSGPPPDAPSIIAQAIRQQLGLRVDAKKAPVDMLIVDHIEKTPTDN
jgi:uncharacterized protein (TIGR03435 family)